MSIPDKPHKALIDCYCGDPNHEHKDIALDILGDVYRAKAFAMLPRTLQDRVFGVLRRKPKN